MGEDRWLLSDVVAKLRTTPRQFDFRLFPVEIDSESQIFVSVTQLTSLPPAKVHQYIFFRCALSHESDAIQTIYSSIFPSIKKCQWVPHGSSCLGQSFSLENVTKLYHSFLPTNNFVKMLFMVFCFHSGWTTCLPTWSYVVLNNFFSLSNSSKNGQCHELLCPPCSFCWQTPAHHSEDAVAFQKQTAFSYICLKTLLLSCTYS